jgi:hypothetical protein
MAFRSEEVKVARPHVVGGYVLTMPMIGSLIDVWPVIESLGGRAGMTSGSRPAGRFQVEFQYPKTAHLKHFVARFASKTMVPAVVR